MKLHFSKDWLRKISMEDLDEGDCTIGPPPPGATEEERELDAMTYAFPPKAARFEYKLGLFACFVIGTLFYIPPILHFFFGVESVHPWQPYAFIAFGLILNGIGIAAVHSRKKHQDYRKKMILEHEAYVAAQLKDYGP